MRNKLSKLSIILPLILVCFMFLNFESFAASMGLSISKKTGYVGDTFTVTISGINGRVNISGNSNVTLNISGSQWVDGSLRITGTAKAEGTGTIKVTPVDVVTDSAVPEEVTAPSSVSIKISKKEEPKVEKPTTQPEPEKPTTSQKPSSSSNKKQTTTTKKETEVKKEEDEGTVSEFGLTSLHIFAINENNEKVEIGLSPKFDIHTSNYTCEVESNISKVELVYEANEYKDLVKITGLENDLKPGQNTININMNGNGKEKSYTIVVNKKEVKVEETLSEESEENSVEIKEKAMVKMPVILFILLELGVVAIAAVVSILIYKKAILKK